MEWRVHAKPGDWIISGIQTWCRESFCSEGKLQHAFEGLMREGMIDYEKGRFPDRPVRVRRRTIEEMKVIVGKRKLTEKQMKLRAWLACGGSVTKPDHGHVGSVPIYAKKEYKVDGDKFDGDDGGIVEGSVVERLKGLVGDTK